MASPKTKIPQGQKEKTPVGINPKTATILYLILAVINTVLLIMAICASASGKAAIYPKVTAFIIILLATTIGISLIAFNPRKSFYDLGFYILHVGIIIFILGMAFFSLKGSVHNVVLPNISSVTEAIENRMKNIYGWNDDELERLRSYRNQIAGEKGEITDLGFNFRIVDFETEYYEDGESVKHYEAIVEFFLRNGTTEKVRLTVNHPIYRNGWKIYLMNVGANVPYGYEQLNLMLKKDPAEFLCVAGIVLTILGTFIMCFLPRKRREVTVNG